MSLDYFCEITLLPGGDISLYFLWEKIFFPVHLALAEMQDKQGGVLGCSFPGYDAKIFQLGNKLRLFAETETDLEKLGLRKVMQNFSDYLHITRVRHVPENVDKFACFFRIQTKSNTERLARRKAKRKAISYEEALHLLENRKNRESKAPFIWMKSLSSGKRYRLMIGRCEGQPTGTLQFSSYGLSRVSSVPVF
ncbi:MAG: type I-F CRISPR-associated endoribonuclease Cas6/Csy4 [Desulforhopalus sp.]|nr:type I-F CRISPR-associated endoribonuclease Cas6/Csy4 [Desulforhopalus sp.]